MKKKTIEKIPFLTLPSLRRKGAVRYVAVTDIRKIAEEPHLFIEVYRNKKGSMDIPAVRIVLTEKDFGTFFPGTGTWSADRIRGGQIWRDDDHEWRSREELEKENVLYSHKDLERIKAFTEETARREESWWDFINQRQKDIAREKYREKSARKYERRQQALEERQRQTPELPEQRILAYADTAIFHDRHTLFYRRHGARVTVACSKCGGVTDVRWKPGQSYESQYEKTIAEPVENHYGVCPLCKEAGLFIPQGRAGRRKKVSGCLFLGQKYKETGFVLRCVQVEKEWNLNELCLGKETAMTGAYEALYGVETARVYFESGKRVQKDYNKHNPYSGKDFWDDCNLSGLNNIVIKPGKIMPETFEEMEDTFLRYSALKEYCAEEMEDINPADYLERYIQTPQIEMLVKLGLTGVAGRLVKCHYGIVLDEDAQRPEGFLGIRKEHVKHLIREKGNTDILKVMQMEKRLNQRWTDSQIDDLAETNVTDQISTVLAHMSVQKFLNRVAKYAGCGYKTGCMTAESRLRSTAGSYVDYLNMRCTLGYDMTNTAYLFPQDLDAAHAKMVAESNKKEADARIREASRRYPLIRKHYRRYRKQFYFADRAFLIRPAKDAGEIITEGRRLHHCVGGDRYLGSHNEGRTIILFLRAVDEPDMPFITVEIDPETKDIRQWYGAHDKKPDRERMQRWLDAYVVRLKCGQEAAEQAAVEQTRIMAAV